MKDFGFRKKFVEPDIWHIDGCSEDIRTSAALDNRLKVLDIAPCESS